MLYFEHSFIKYLNWDNSKSRLGIPWSVEVWCWGRLKKIIWTNHVKSKRYYRQSRSKEISYTTERKNAKWDWSHHAQELRSNAHYWRKTKEKTEEKERRWRRLQQLLDYLKVKRGYWKYIQEVPASNLCRTYFGKFYGHILRRTRWWWWWRRRQQQWWWWWWWW